MESRAKRRRGPRAVWVWLSSLGVFLALFGFEMARMASGQDPVIKKTSSTTTQQTQTQTQTQTTQTPQSNSGSSQDYTPSSPPSTGSS